MLNAPPGPIRRSLLGWTGVQQRGIRDIREIGKPSTVAVGASTWQAVFGATILVIELTSILVEELLVRMCEARR